VYWSFPEQKPSIEEYNRLNNVTSAQESDVGDIPEDTPKQIKALDERALNEGKMVGKWMIFVSPDEINEIWADICELVDNKMFWLAKASTNWARKKKQYDKHAVFVYTPNYLDIDDIKRVRNVLREECGFTDDLQYKTDYYAHLGIYPDTISEWDVETEARYNF